MAPTGTVPPVSEPVPADDALTDVDAVTPCCDRAPGRPRSVEADRAILAATVELLACEGYAGLSMEGVAARAGVGKATVYRRWPSKTDLVVHALRCVTAKREMVPDTGTVRGDLVAYLTHMLHKVRGSEAGRIMPGLLAELSRNPELAAAFRQGFVEPRRAEVAGALRRGIERGELRPDFDVDLVVDLGSAVFHHRMMLTGMPIDDGLPERLADLLLRGIAAAG